MVVVVPFGCPLASSYRQALLPSVQAFEGVAFEVPACVALQASSVEALRCQRGWGLVVVPVLYLQAFAQLRCSFLLPVLNFDVSLLRCLLGCGDTGWLVAKVLVSYPWHDYFLFLAVLAAFLNDLAVGAPLVPGFRIDSPLPALILFRLA